MPVRFEEVSNSPFPFVDLSKIANNSNVPTSEKDWAELGNQLVEALKTDGFAYLVNHGIPDEKVNNVFKISREFFDLPLETKLKYKKSSEKFDFQGYMRGEELPTKKHEMREMFDVWGTNTRYPNADLPAFKPLMDELEVEFKAIGKKLLRALGNGLKLEDEEYLVKSHTGIDDMSKGFVNFRTLGYPPLEEDYDVSKFPPGTLRCREHTDYGTITLIFQDSIGGLEVRMKDGSYVQAEPIEGTILCNVSDLFELWTGGKLPACVHRVPVPDDERKNAFRQSISYFIYPDMNIQVKPLLPPLDPENGRFASYPDGINASEYFVRPVQY